MRYVYSKDGKEIVRDFPIGRSPSEINGYKKVIKMPAIHFRDKEFSKYIPKEVLPKITERVEVGKMTRAEYDAI